MKDTDGFLAECRQGRELGFDGKTLIHPGQVEGANAAFAPSEQAVEDARGILAGLGGRRRLRRGHLQRPDDREPPRRVRPAHARDPRGDQAATAQGVRAARSRRTRRRRRRRICSSSHPLAEPSQPATSCIILPSTSWLDLNASE